jgi:hypothetical protein
VTSTRTVVDLPAPFSAQQPALAPAHGERNAVERLHLAVPFLQVVDDDRIHQHRD